MILESIVAKLPSAAKCAAALGMSRQAFQQAQRRRALSPACTIRAAQILNIDAAAALLDQISDTLPAAERAALDASRKNTPAPIITPCPAPADDPAYTQNDYKLCEIQEGKKKTDYGQMQNVHVLTTPDQDAAIEIIRWCMAVAKLSADSPRFNWYVSRWRVPEKIAAAKAAGTLSEHLRNCPPIDPAWVRFVPAALAAYRDFISPSWPKQPPNTIRADHQPMPEKTARQSSSQLASRRKPKARAA